ncbi:hypothetical protein [Segatella bryantii]|nr:hypothetical protein [Segatella bryantii]UKK75263.1 hypothetical protein L6471_02005 [Segatella bryantii]UKK81850.1 hypothetical protein L6474_12020 [Segatella bryantii]
MTEQYGNQKMGAFILMLDYNVRHDAENRAEGEGYQGHRGLVTDID